MASLWTWNVVGSYPFRRPFCNALSQTFKPSLSVPATAVRIGNTSIRGYVTISNKAEGCAPLSARVLAEGLSAEPL